MVIPFCFSLFQTLKVENSDFKNIMGKINTVSIYSEKLMRLFPFLLILFLVLKYFNFYSRFMFAVGLEDLNAVQIHKQQELSVQMIENEMENLCRNTIV